MDAEVVVVGGGPVGLALSAVLAGGGVDVVVFERAEAPDPRPRASHVHGAVLCGLHAAGVRDADLVAGRPNHGARFVHDGREICEVDTRVLDVRRPWSLAIPQPELEGLLERRAVERGARVRRGAEVQRVDPAAPSVEVDGRAHRARWLVGCDGAGSAVRAALGEPLRGLTLDGVALADVATGHPPIDAAHLHTGPGGLAFRVPLRDGERWVASLPAGAGPDDVPRLVAERIPGVEAESVRWTSEFRLHARWARRWRHGRVLLAGDAAHLHSPVGGHGMNTGLLDALDLGWKLVQVLRHGAPDALIDSYARTRRAAARWSVLQAWGATLGLRATNPLLAAARSWAAGVAARRATAHVARWSVGLDVAVPGRDHARGGRAIPGWRAPDARAGDGWWLDALGPLPTAFTRAGWDPPPGFARAELPDLPDLFGDAEALLVRPDGFLAWRGPRAGLDTACAELRGGRA